MAEKIEISGEVIYKLQLVQEFITGLYFGRRYYKDRIVFILNTLDDVIKQLKDLSVHCPSE